MKLSTAVESDEELKGLRALRRELAKQLEECDSKRDYAALSLRLMDVMERISELKKAVPVQASAFDEIRARRERKRPIRDGAKREA